MQPLLEFMSIFALMQQVWPYSVPAFISDHIFMFCSTAARERHREELYRKKSHVARLQHSLTGHHHRPVLSRTIVSAGGLNTLLPLLLHLLRWGVVDVSFALSKQLLCKLHYSGKVVTGVSELVWTDLEHGNIFQDHLKSSTAKKCEHKT